MISIDTNRAQGELVELVLSNPKHLDSKGAFSGIKEGGNSDFANMLSEAVGKVSDAQNYADNLFEEMIINPDSVEIHDVTTAMAEAEMSLRLTKAVIDRAIKAYNDITMMR